MLVDVSECLQCALQLMMINILMRITHHYNKIESMLQTTRYAVTAVGQLASCSLQCERERLYFKLMLLMLNVVFHVWIVVRRLRVSLALVNLFLFSSFPIDHRCTKPFNSDSVQFVQIINQFVDIAFIIIFLFQVTLTTGHDMCATHP